jgi:hypothetical protein
VVLVVKKEEKTRKSALARNLLLKWSAKPHASSGAFHRPERWASPVSGAQWPVPQHGPSTVGSRPVMFFWLHSGGVGDPPLPLAFKFCSFHDREIEFPKSPLCQSSTPAYRFRHTYRNPILATNTSRPHLIAPLPATTHAEHTPTNTTTERPLLLPRRS